MPFLAPAAARLEEQRVVATEALADAHARQGRAADDVALLEELAARDPLRESVAVQLVRALYAAGRQADALAAYDRCCGGPGRRARGRAHARPAPGSRGGAGPRAPARCRRHRPAHPPAAAEPVVRGPAGPARGRRRDPRRRHPPPARRRADGSGRGRARPSSRWSWPTSGTGTAASPGGSPPKTPPAPPPGSPRWRPRWGSPRSSGARTPGRRCGPSSTARRAGCSSTTTRTSPRSSSRSCPRPGTAT